VIALNPGSLDRDRYIAFLNRSFPKGWDRESHDWYLARDFNGETCDLLVGADGDRILAGVSLCYRQVRAGLDAPIDVCVAGAGATLPGERRRGHYAEIMRAAVERAKARGCAAMLGFVTRNNTSGRGLIRMGARVTPSFYLVSPGAPAAHRQQRSRSSNASSKAHWAPADLGSVARLLENRRGTDAERCTAVRFHYERPEDWKRQFLLRPHTVRAMRKAHDCHALIETVGDTDRLQYLSGPAAKESASIAALALESRKAGRRFFSYTLDPLAAAAARRAGLRIRHGYLVITPTGLDREEFDRLARSRWRIQSGDRL
jgi:GNAT superfamily N-acetyltransferase